MIHNNDRKLIFSAERNVSLAVPTHTMKHMEHLGRLKAKVLERSIEYHAKAIDVWADKDSIKLSYLVLSARCSDQDYYRVLFGEHAVNVSFIYNFKERRSYIVCKHRAFNRKTPERPFQKRLGHEKPGFMTFPPFMNITQPSRDTLEKTGNTISHIKFFYPEELSTLLFAQFGFKVPLNWMDIAWATRTRSEDPTFRNWLDFCNQYAITNYDADHNALDDVPMLKQVKKEVQKYLKGHQEILLDFVV